MKTSELTGAVLDYAVALAKGVSWWRSTEYNWGTDEFSTEWIMGADGTLKRFRFDGPFSGAGSWAEFDLFTPSTDWAQGGPIIGELILKKGLVLRCWVEQQQCQASLDFPYKFHYGPTPLIAAMRCFVASELGDELDVPKELA